MVENNTDILLILETKLDDSFSSGQFKICGFSMPYWCDRNSMDGGRLLYIRDDIPTKLLNMILELILKICPLKLIYKQKKKMVFQWLLQSA